MPTPYVYGNKFLRRINLNLHIDLWLVYFINMLPALNGLLGSLAVFFYSVRFCLWIL